MSNITESLNDLSESLYRIDQTLHGLDAVTEPFRVHGKPRAAADQGSDPQRQGSPLAEAIRDLNSRVVAIDTRLKAILDEFDYSGEGTGPMERGHDCRGGGPF